MVIFTIIYSFTIRNIFYTIGISFINNEYLSEIFLYPGVLITSMKRKIIKQGHKTLTITLPRKWCERCGIEAGDEVDLMEAGSSLLLNCEKETDPNKAEINVTGLDRISIAFYIRSMYRRGFDEITVKFDKPITRYYRGDKEVSVISAISHEVNRLIGVEIIDQKSNKVVIRDISADSFKDFDNLLRKVFLLIKESFDVLYTGLEQKRASLGEEVQANHDTATKFISYCLRLLNKRGHEDYKNTASYYSIILLLDMITDQVKYAARMMEGYSRKPHKDTIDMVGNLRKTFELFYQMYYNPDLDRYSHLGVMRDTILRKMERNLERLPVREMMLVRDLSQMLHLIREAAAVRMGMVA